MLVVVWLLCVLIVGFAYYSNLFWLCLICMFYTVWVIIVLIVLLHYTFAYSLLLSFVFVTICLLALGLFVYVV